jgi:anti-sigma B factor antagonist
MAEAAPFKHIAIFESAGLAVVEFVNSKLVYTNESIQEIGNELSRVITEHGHTKIVLDFRNVQYLSSMMLARLAKLQQQVDNVKGQLKICGLGPVLKDTFRIGHFEKIFDIHDDVQSALTSIR